MRRPLALYDSEAASGMLKRTGGAFLGDTGHKLCTSFIYPHQVSQNSIFYINGVPTKVSLNKSWL